MSLELARQIDREHPHLLETNIGATCHLYTLRLIALLRSKGHDAHLMAKTHGEGQYTPPGFTPRNVIGRDGQVYICTGVSHDAIWVDGVQVDTAARANDGDEPIYENDEKKARGERMTAVPVWNLIAPHLWRAKNPPLKDFVIPAVPEPTPVPPQAPVVKPYPGDAYFTEKIGVPLEADYRAAGQTLNAGSATWFARTIWRHVNEGMPIDQSVEQSRKEWLAALGRP